MSTGEIGKAPCVFNSCKNRCTESEFVSLATHQLRTPLTAIKGYASNILDGDYGDISKGAADAIEVISESAHTLSSIVEDYLNASRIDLGMMRYDFREHDMGDIVSWVIREIEPNIKKTRLNFCFSATHDDYTALLDEHKIKQAIINLIDNSLKYTPKGSVTVRLSREGETIRFSVKDTGIGIPADVLPNLFQRFSRAENAEEANIHGTGLGLFVAREVVLAHGGRIWAESEGEGKGANFVIEIPAKDRT